MKYAVEIGSGAHDIRTSFIKTGSVIQKLMGGGYKDTDSMVIT
jgi:hypothetical protein